MATQTRAARLTVACISDFEKGVLDSISDPFVYSMWLKENGLFKTNKKGSALEFKIATARGTVTGMSPEATSNFTPVNPAVNVSFTNKGYKTTDLVHNLDLAEASGAQQIFDIVENRTAWMPEAIWRGFNTEAYIGDGSTDNGYGTNGILGLDAMVITTGTYGGQTVTTETALKGQVLSAGVHASFSTDPFPSLTASILACYRGTDKGMGEYKPSDIFIDVTGFGYVLNAANDLRRSVSHETDMKLGTETAKFMGCKIIMDRIAPALKYYTMNKKYIEVHTPFGSPIQTARKEELSPFSVSLLCFFYGKHVVKLPRAFARTTYA